MPRRGNVPKREILPDPMYNSVLVTKLVNSIMLDGKKGVAQKVVYGAFDIIKEKTEKEPLEVFTQAMENIMPSLEVKARRAIFAPYAYWGFFRMADSGGEGFYVQRTVHVFSVGVETNDEVGLPDGFRLHG